ncbi:ultraviolet-B receptor UVR8-like [Chenopodium quinoa]|uniref:ultraviolet-B receptor UVR8-like n=1 Tax=Chenopodium quinoa TaxID=63459 RepID=UPI000B772F9C|nr:ultraviolet-B receptor UVR8-like [Chenopodium quinoa]
MADVTETPELSPRNPAHKIVAVAAGEAHTLALSGDGKVYSWGRGTFGRLGNGSQSDEKFPVPIKWDNDGDLGNEKCPKFVGVAAGAYHSLALADDGSIWCWGYNTYNQLGFEGENVSVPRQLDMLVQLNSPRSLGDDSEGKSKNPLKVCAIEAGGMMSLAIDNLGALWMWGNIPQQRSPDDDTFTLISVPDPVPMFDFYGHTVVKVACGNEHVVALVSAGEKHIGDDLVCYTWGNNNHGQLGLGDTESRSHPQAVAQFSEGSAWRAYDVACGSFHTVVLTLKKQPSDTLASVCWTFGLGENGQLGHGTTQSTSLPEPARALPENAYFVSVDCGLLHTSVVSSAGEVWSWGMEKGLGLCPDVSFSGVDHGDAILPLQFSCNGSNFPDPVEVACGAAHTVLVADDGYKLWSWGRGRSGVLGDGKVSDSYSPTMVLWPPLSEDFSDGLNIESKKPKEGGEKTEVDEKLDSAMEEMKLLQSKLSVMERYVSILHGSLFAKPFEESDIPASLIESDSFDVGKAWQGMLEAADGKELRRLEMFYGNMLDGVKDKIMKRKIQEIVREHLQSSSTTQY